MLCFGPRPNLFCFEPEETYSLLSFLVALIQDCCSHGPSQLYLRRLYVLYCTVLCCVPPASEPHKTPKHPRHNTAQSRNPLRSPSLPLPRRLIITHPRFPLSLLSSLFTPPSPSHTTSTTTTPHPSLSTTRSPPLLPTLTLTLTLTHTHAHSHNMRESSPRSR
jgi:hypothetical protein